MQGRSLGDKGQEENDEHEGLQEDRTHGYSFQIQNNDDSLESDVILSKPCDSLKEIGSACEPTNDMREDGYTISEWVPRKKKQKNSMQFLF